MMKLIIITLLLQLLYFDVIISIPLKVKLFTSSNIPNIIPNSNNIEITKPLKLPIWSLSSSFIYLFIII